MFLSGWFSYPDIQEMEVGILVKHFSEVSTEYFEALQKVVQGDSFDVLKMTIRKLGPGVRH